MVKKMPEGQKIIFLVQYQERLLDWKAWIDKAEELLAGARALEPHVRRRWEFFEEDFRQGRYSEGGEHPRQLPQDLQGDTQGVYFMLVAYALENLFKAVIIWEHQGTLKGQVINTGGKLPAIAKSHDLIHLARKVHFVIDVSDEDLLTRLQLNSVWAGRYPVPVDWGGLKNVKVYSNGKAYLTAYFAPHDLDRLNGLLQRVKTHVANTLNSSEIKMSQ